MRVRKNRPIERAGVNAVRALFEACGHVFQEVDLGNDYGKDAYVDLVEDGNVSGVCVSLQIKSGKKYHRASGYAIPLDEHEEVWRRSTLPIAGIVHDPDSGRLYWGSITSFLAEYAKNPPAAVPISSSNVLTAETLETQFKPFFRVLARERAAATAVLQICSDREDLQIGALLDCFALGRSDARVFIIIRYLLAMLGGEALRYAVGILAHLTPHPDIRWTKSNWVPEELGKVVAPHLRWRPEEIRQLLSEIGWDEWERGNSGQDLYLILRQDPEVGEKVEQVAVEAMREGDETAAWAALYLAVYWAGEQGPEKYEQLLRIEPELRTLDLIGDLEYALGECGYVTLF
jgi:hypothetical protein